MLGTALGATFEHTFTFVKNNAWYINASMMEDPRSGSKYLGNHHLEELPNVFGYNYDSGDGWDFHCRKYKKYMKLI